MRMILASGSPRRKDLMRKITDDFEIITADVDERAIENEIMKTPEVLALLGRDDSMQEVAKILCQKLALEKAKAAGMRLMKSGDAKREAGYIGSSAIGADDGSCLIIGCDTSVALPDEILGKPKDRDDAVRMLRKESLAPQYVITGVALVMMSGGQCDAEKTFCEVSRVVFHELDDVQEEKIQNYCDTDEPYDKAGAYGIQLLGDKLVDHIEGDFNNIVGFPVDRILKEIKQFVEDARC